MEDVITKDKIKKEYALALSYLNKGRPQKFVSIALTLIALSFFGFLAINPTISTILRLQKELEDSKFVYEQLGTKIDNLSQLRIQYANLQSSLPTVTDAISTKPDAHVLMAQLQAAAKKSNIKIKELQNFEVEVLKNKGHEKDYYSYSFSIGGNGSFENINNFVSTITNMQRIIMIDILSINNSSNQDSQSLGFTIQGEAFFKR